MTLSLNIASDLHVEMNSISSILQKLDPTGVDALILAGDIGRYDKYYVKSSSQLLIDICSMFPTVYMTFGNHDHWNLHPRDLQPYIESLKIDNLRLLVPGLKYILGDYTISGGTLWFSEPNDYGQYLMKYWCDNEHIYGFIPWVYEQNKLFKDVVMGDAGPKDIIVSHHLPSELSVGEQWKDSDTNCFFVDPDVHSLIEAKQPALYIHGHSHQAFDYKIGNTRVYSNPKGYKNENANPNFWNRIKVELP